MKYVQRDPGQSAENSSGGGTRGTLRELLTLTALVCLAMTVLYFGIAFLTDLAVAGISVDRERRMFGGFSPAIATGSEIPEQYAEEWALLESVLGKLSHHPGVVALDYRLVLMAEDEPNAFAIPGGTIGVTSGLLDSLEGEIPMAFVIGHELGHFAHRDHLKGMGRRIGFSIAVRVVFGGGIDSMTSKGAELMLLSYSRKQETLADAFAMECLDAVYGRHDGAGQLFEILDQSADLPDWAYMFSTHPDSQARLRLLSEKWR